MTWRRSLTMSEARRALARGEVAPADLSGWPWDDATSSTDALTWRAPRPEDPAAAGPLAGFAAAIKANICVRDHPTDCGSRLLAGWRAPYDATAVARLRRAGALLAGTAAMDEFGMGSSGEYAVSGPTANPWREDRTPGGSSSGSAAAVARGLVWFALGSDTGGSVRQPAHCCGLVGLKPTWGRVSRHGLVAFASSLDTVGILARGVEDAGLVLDVIAGADPRDATCAAAPPPPTPPPRTWRVAVPRALVDEHADPSVARCFHEILTELRRLGTTVHEVRPEGATHALAAYGVLAAAEAASNLSRFDGSIFGVRRQGRDYGTTLRTTRSAGFGPEVKRRILLGTEVLTADCRAGYLARARQVRQRLREGLRRVFDHHDALLLPTAPTGAAFLGSRRHDPVAMYRDDVFTVGASLAGLPAVSVPMGCNAEGLPLGLQIVGPPWSEQRLLALAGMVEKEVGFRSRKEAPWHRHP